MRARNIKPGFYRDAALVELPIEARLLFPGLWMLADRAGRLIDRPKQIKMEIYPADGLDVDALLGMLAAAKLIIRYQVDEENYIQIKAFAKHQNPHVREPTSTIPAPDENCASTIPAPDMTGAGPADILNPDSGILNPEQVKSSPTRKSSAPARVNGSEAKTAKTWAAYSIAYRARYSAGPTRNKKVNGILARFIERVPAEEAPEIAAFYLGSDRGLYVSAHHCVDLLLRDAEALRTEWQTGRHEAPAVRRAVV